MSNVTHILADFIAQLEHILSHIYTLSLPDTPNPFHSYTKLGQIDEKYLNSVIELLPKEKENINTKNMKYRTHKNELALFQAKNIRRRRKMLPMVKTSMQLLGSVFNRKWSNELTHQFGN